MTSSTYRAGVAVVLSLTAALSFLSGCSTETTSPSIVRPTSGDMVFLDRRDSLIFSDPTIYSDTLDVVSTNATAAGRGDLVQIRSASTGESLYASYGDNGDLELYTELPPLPWITRWFTLPVSSHSSSSIRIDSTVGNAEIHMTVTNYWKGDTVIAVGNTQEEASTVGLRMDGQVLVTDDLGLTRQQGFSGDAARFHFLKSAGAIVPAYYKGYDMPNAKAQVIYRFADPTGLVRH